MSQISLYAIKPKFVASLRGVVSWCDAHRVSPNAVTLSALPVALTAGVALVVGSSWPAAWTLVGPLMILLMAINAVDGSLARTTGQSTPRGAAINELVDRFGDLAVLLPAFVLVPGWAATSALVVTLLSEIVALVSWGAIGERGLVGLMGKPDRALTVAAGALAALVVGPGAFLFAYLVVGLGSCVTALQRIRWLVRHAR